MQITKGIHHITAIASDPATNFEFYTGILGLRLVKKTVNFDDPNTYHLYYGDELGSPGTIITFFPWSGAPRGSSGAGEPIAVSFAVPSGSLSYWSERLRDWRPEPIVDRLSDRGLVLRDPDGMSVELVESGAPTSSSSNRGVAREAAITGFFSTTLNVRDRFPTQQLLTEGMGLRLVAEDGLRFRYGSDWAPGTYVDLVPSGAAARGRMGAGSIHHIAFRAEDDVDQLVWQRELEASGFDLSPVMDRRYFHSIYFREPGGVLFEIATDPPGFAVDERVESLGERLMLPDWLESSRSRIESVLPPLGGAR